jgi:hypothetical protein
MIDPKKYSESYNVIWTEQFHNVSSEALKSSWQTLATAFNDCIIDNTENREIKRRVVSIPTGSGKTTGLVHYLGMLGADTKALIVTAFIDSADELELKLNEHTKNKAIAIHSKNGRKISDIGNQQILIVTHNHFTMNMYKDHINERDLIVIDEAIDLLTEHTINNESLQRLRNIINVVCFRSDKILKDVKDELDKLNGFIDISKAINDQLSKPTIINGEEFNMDKKEFLIAKTDGFKYLKLDKLRKIIKENNCSRIALGKALDEIKEREFKKELLEMIDTIEFILKDWFYYYSKNGTLKDSTLNSVTIKLPNKSVVVLDATATTNHLYKLFDDVVLYPDSENARNYSNVELYIAKNSKTGISAIMDKPKEKAEILIKNLEEHLDSSNNVLIVTRKKFVPYVLDYEVIYNYEVENYGNLTGKNNWQNYDTVVLYGLMHKPETFNINRQAMATTPADAMEDKDIRDKLKATDLASEVIQAINRVRCRKVIDENGNCDHTKVFLTLPSGTIGEIILQSITSKMNNIVVKDWDIITTLERTSSKKSSWLNSVISYVKANLQADENLTATVVQKALGISKANFYELCNKDYFQEELSKNNLSLQLPPNRKRGKAFYRLSD